MNQDLNRPQPVVPQPASCVEIHEEGDLELLTAETDPVGTVMMSANMVEIMNEERERMVIERVRNGVYTMEDVAYLAAMAEKIGIVIAGAHSACNYLHTTSLHSGVVYIFRGQG